MGKFHETTKVILKDIFKEALDEIKGIESSYVVIANWNHEYDRELLNKVYTPVGLDIKAETPEEIALSIMAEIYVSKNNASGISLSKLTICPDINIIYIYNIKIVKIDKSGWNL